jgi:hypothetical protein
LNSIARRILALLPVAALALILTLLFGGGDNARAMLQVSTLSTPTPFVSPPELPTPEPGQPTIEAVPSLEPPTPVPLPAEVGSTPTPRGFLPAPTIVNPNDVKSLPLAQPPVSGAGSSTQPTSVPTRTPDETVELLNYFWLICGGVIVIGGLVVMFLLWRHTRRL